MRKGAYDKGAMKNGSKRIAIISALALGSLAAFGFVAQEGGSFGGSRCFFDCIRPPSEACSTMDPVLYYEDTYCYKSEHLRVHRFYYDCDNSSPHPPAQCSRTDVACVYVDETY